MFLLRDPVAPKPETKNPSSNRDVVQIAVVLGSLMIASSSCEEFPADAPAIRQFLLECEWPHQNYVRETLVLLSEDNFESVPEFLQADFRAFAAGHNTTLMIENLFRQARAAARECHTGKLEAFAFWHAMACKGTLLQDFDRPNIDGRPKSATVPESSTTLPKRCCVPQQLSLLKNFPVLTFCFVFHVVT